MAGRREFVVGHGWEICASVCPLWLAPVKLCVAVELRDHENDGF
jgi:hypothetical protein